MQCCCGYFAVLCCTRKMDPPVWRGVTVCVYVCVCVCLLFMYRNGSIASCGGPNVSVLRQVATRPHCRVMLLLCGACVVRVSIMYVCG